MKRIASLLIVLVALATAKVNFGLAQNADQLAQATPEFRQLLSDNGFVAQTTDYIQLYDLYNTIRKSNQPMLVTTDCVLHSFHVLFDYALRDIETRHFYPDIAALTQALVAWETRVLAGAKQPKTREALLGNLAYLSVAAALLDTGFKVPRKVEKLVKAELALIDAHAGITKSPIFGIREDYSQYVPRGHYTRSELLKRYFRAMMWFGRMGFDLKPGNSEKDIELGRKLTYQALLLCDAIKQVKVGADNGLNVWNRIYEPTVLLVGKSDDLGFKEYNDLAYEIFGDKNLLPNRPNDVSLDRFISKALALRAPQIVNRPVEDTLEPAQVTSGFRLMGQRYIPDSHIFQELVYNKVGSQDDPRMMPRGLDVFAALGSAPARRILKELYHEDRYQNYEQQLDKLVQEFDQLTPDDWNQNVYYGWLYALRLQNQPVAKSKSLPEFPFAPAYADKCLVTTSASWAQLRHDTILYAKQSYTMLTTAMPERPEPPPNPVVFVEPRPEVFAQVLNITDKIITRLTEHGVLSEDVGSRLDLLRVATGILQAIADKEIRGEKQDPGELIDAWHIGDRMEDFAEFPGDETTNDEDKDMATVADVHTDPNSKTVLEVAVGHPLHVFALVPFAGKQYIATGGMFSYYEFTQPMDKRLTDAQWQEMKNRPAMPEWTKSFVVQ